MFQAVDVIKQYVCFKQSVSSGLCYQAVCIKQSMFQVVYVIKQSVCIKPSVLSSSPSVSSSQSMLSSSLSVSSSQATLWSSQSMYQAVSQCFKQSAYWAVSVSSSQCISQSTYQAVSLRIKQSVYIIKQSAYVWNSQSTLLLPIRHSRFEMQCLAFQGQVWQVQSFSLKLTEVFYKYLTNFKTDESGH